MTPSRASTRTWSGGGANGNWSTSGNWSSTPVAGDDLVFPAGAARLANTNDFVNRGFNSITISGSNYVIQGNALSVSNNFSAQNVVGTNVFNPPLTLGKPQTLDCTSASATLILGGAVALGTNNTIFNAVGKLQVTNAISGSGTVTKNSAGTLRFEGAPNTYTNATTINGGTLELAKSAGATAIAGRIVIGNGTVAATLRSFFDDEIADTSDVTVNRFSVFDLSDQNETIAGLTLSGGSVTTGLGALTLGGNVSVLASATTASVSGNLSLGGATRAFDIAAGAASPDLSISASISDGASSAGIIQTSGGELTLSGANTFSGPATFSGVVTLANDFALGTAGDVANGTTLNAGGTLIVSNANIGDEVLTLASGTSFQSIGTASWSGPITLNGNVFVAASPGTFTCSGALSGNGGITKSQSGTLIFSGPSANTYLGNTTVNDGVLQLGKDFGGAIQHGSLTIGDDLGGNDADVVRDTASAQISSAVPILINSSGLLDLNGSVENIGALTLNGGHVASGAGALVLLDDVIANANANNFARLDGNLVLSGTRTFTVSDGVFSPDLQINASISGAGALTKNGLGELSLTASNSYTGLTTINAGWLDVFDSSALGATSSGTIVASGAALVLNGGVHVGAESLTLNGAGNGTLSALNGASGSNSWDGPITLGSDASVSAAGALVFLNLAGAIGGTGNLSKNGAGTVILSGSDANTYIGTTFANDGTLLLAKSVSDGAIPGALTIGNGGAPLSDIVRLVGAQQIADAANITINSSGWLDLNGVAEGISTLSGAGRVDLGSGALILNGNGNATYSGVIGGTTGFLSKNGSGIFTLAGNNTYPGGTFVNSGALVVNGSQSASTITVGASGTLGGTGTVGNIISVGGHISPGTSPGILTSSNIAFDASTVFNVELNGPNAGSDYDQLNVRGTNNLGGAQLAVQLGNGFVPMEGQQFTILNNDGTDAIVGTFTGLPNNSVLTAANGLRFHIRYSDAFNNDVILTATNLIARIASTTVVGGNGNSGVDANECNFLSVALTNVTGATLSALTATLVSKTPGVSVTYGTVNYSNIAAGAVGTNTVPFQFTTSPAFGCGNIQFDFLLSTPANGAITVPLSFSSGSPGASIGFSNNTAAAIPDLGVTNSTVTVSGITSTIAAVIVSLNIAHTFDSDLSITLIGPDGTAIDLSSGNGGNFDNYGTSCSQRTTFSDAAATSITAGTPPFVGTFRPEQPLATFIGKSGTNVNGTWTLRIADGAAGDTGTLNCWSLFIAPAVCGDGGGACDSCPENWTITGQLGSGSLTQTGRLIRTFTTVNCNTSKTCPGGIGVVPNHYDAYAFENGESNACVTVTLSAPCDLFSAAYLGSYSPANFCQNYLSDMGNSTGPSGSNSYSFNVPARARFVVVVSEVDAGGCNYTLRVNGGSCRPSLKTFPAAGGNVVFDWSTSAVGYELEKTNSISGGLHPLWLPATPAPVMVNGRLRVTNNVSGSKQFYQLHKP